MAISFRRVVPLGLAASALIASALCAVDINRAQQFMGLMGVSDAVIAGMTPDQRSMVEPVD